MKRDLFDKLSADSKKLISDLTISCMKVNGFENYVYTDFCEDLIKSEDTFVNERYVFEIIPGKSHGLQCGFLLSFATALNALSKALE